MLQSRKETTLTFGAQRYSIAFGFWQGSYSGDRYAPAQLVQAGGVVWVAERQSSPPLRGGTCRAATRCGSASGRPLIRSVSLRDTFRHGVAGYFVAPRPKPKLPSPHIEGINHSDVRLLADSTNRSGKPARFLFMHRTTAANDIATERTLEV